MDAPLTLEDFDLFMTVEVLLGLYQALALPRRVARQRLMVNTNYNPGVTAWFDMRWPVAEEGE